MPEAWLRPLRFGLVGVANTLVDFVVFLLLLRLGLWPAPAAAGGFACGTINSYLLNRSWTFRDAPRRASWAQFLGFATTSLLGLALTVGIVGALSPAVGAVWAKLFAIGVGFGFNYACSRMLVFRSA